MLKRKVVMLFLLAALLMLPFPTGAEVCITNTEHGMTGTTVVRLVIPSGYIVEIPASLSIPYGAEATPMAVGVSSMELGPQKSVRIAVDSARGLLLQAGGNGEIPYVLQQEGTEFSSWLYNAAGQTQLSVNIALEDWFEAAAGEYTGALTFRVSVEDQEVAP